NTGIDPLEKPAVNRALRTKTGRRVLPFRSVIEHPKNAGNHLSLIGGRSPSLRTAFRIRYLPRKPIQLLFAKCQHSNNLASTMPHSGFGISCSPHDYTAGAAQRRRAKLSQRLGMRDLDRAR